MENEIGLKSISELLGMNFFIPSYQRGYRWTSQQVEDLLEDIYSFANKKNKSEKEFYCLQPIVVKKCTNEEKTRNNLQSELDTNQWYEVIDGQQRLTTISVLISFIVKELYSGNSLFDRHKKHPFRIEYETRKDTRSFLENIENSTETIDFYHISEAYSTIANWFNKNPKIDDPQQAKETIRNTLISSKDTQKQEGIVQIIWYEMQDSVKSIDTFIRINMGKIPLTNAELIKALFLQKRNFGSDDIAELRQIEISNEWDKMEYALQEDDFWWFLNKGQNDIPARIEFLFDLICNVARQEDAGFDRKYGTDKHTTFRYFNVLLAEKGTTFEVVKENWNTVKDCFHAFEEWFHTPIWYHYIGYLIYCGINIIEIYKLYQGETKEKFTKKLMDKIKEQKFFCEKLGDQYQIDLVFDGKNKSKIRQLLLLFNIEFIVKHHKALMEKNKKDDDYFIMKFPFELFKKEGWDVEHIDSQTPNEKDRIEWLKTAKDDLEDEVNKNKQLSLDIENFIQNGESNKVKFDDIYRQLTEMAGDVENDEDTKNSMGNLTLLNHDINRGYGNSLYSTKRRIIIGKDMEGKFIPICTKHVFLKYFDKKGTTRTKWTSEDIQNYQNHICNVLDYFLTLKQKKS